MVVIGGLRLYGSRVVLRRIVEADLGRLLQILLEPEISQWWRDYDVERLRADTLHDAHTTSLAVELSNGEIIGLILFAEELDPHYKSASMDISLATAYLGQGLGPDALRAVARYLFAERGHHRLTIDPAVVNTRAIAAYEKTGFRPVGVLRHHELGPGGVWRDALLLDMLEGELR